MSMAEEPIACSIIDPVRKSGWVTVPIKVLDPVEGLLEIDLTKVPVGRYQMKLTTKKIDKRRGPHPEIGYRTKKMHERDRKIKMALFHLYYAVQKNSGYWTESVANAMQEAKEAMK